MLRRDFLKTAIITTALPRPGGSHIMDYGWLPPSLPQISPSFHDIYPQLEGIGEGKVVLLYKYIEAILKRSLPAHRQKGPDCTSHASGLGIDVLSAIQVTLRRNNWMGKIATEILHVGSRKLIGKRNDGGVQIKEAIAFLTKYGYLLRRKYTNQEESYDFRNYDYNLCKQLTKKGIPKWLLKECKKHRLIKAVKVSTWSEVRDAVRNLCPIVIGSDVGFSKTKRDKDGFAKPKDTWYHAWLLIGIDDRFKRPGGCLISSHGDGWVKGPRRYNQPQASIWVDKEIVEVMVKKYGDSYALCRVDRLRPPRYKLWRD